MQKKFRIPTWSFMIFALIGLTNTAHACALSFTSPGHLAKVSTSKITVRGTGSGDASTGDQGTVTATLNGTTFFSQSGSFTAMVSFLESRGVSVTLRPGANYFSVKGSVGGCTASDSMTVYYDTSAVVPIKNLGGGETDQAGGPSTCAGNPINFAMGIKVQEEEDYRSALEHHPLQLTRHFSSADGYWRHNYATRLLVETSRVTLFFPDGRGIPFTRSGVTITADADELGHLVQTSTGWLYTAVDNSRYAFNVDGRLIQQSEPYGLHHNLTYGPGGSITVTDSFGNSFSFTEDAHFQPRSLTAPGISVTYTYDSSDRLLSATKTADATVVGTRTYHYENTTYPRFLTGITDELDVRYATFTYDSQGRAISSSHAAGADLTQVTYNANCTVTVTNPLGKQSTYHFATIQGIKRIAQIVGEPAPNCPASNSTFTYDTRGLLASQTDHLGHITQHTYNVRGLRTSTTEAVGTAQQRVTTTTWHPTLPLPMQIVEPQRTTTYTRDTQGRVLTRTIAD